MSLEFEKSPIQFSQEKYFSSTGIINYPFFTGISANTWDEFSMLMSSLSSEDGLVVTPELMTYVGLPFKNLFEERENIESKVVQVQQISQKKDLSILLGTPTFVDGQVRNSALLIQNGEIIDQTNKRAGLDHEEKIFFEFIPEEPPFILSETKTAILICADLPTSLIYDQYKDEYLNSVLKATNRDLLIGKSPTFIAGDCTRLIVMSCWATGSIFSDANEAHFRIQMRNIAWKCMKYNPQIEEISFIDRVPKDKIGIFSPLNAYFAKK